MQFEFFITYYSEEKKKTDAESESQIVDLSLPGWGTWTGAATIERDQFQKAKRSKINKRLLFKLPKAPPRKDSNKGHVIINEEKNNKFKEHLVSSALH